ncbi:MAG TPA: HAD family phosphatase, partial [Thermoanaerobaculia bacterium]|nr:HAD family phosphatase [Thermoanaerobaculia bacterium]
MNADRRLPKPFAAVVWDVDGVLLDSEPLHYRALLRVCHRFGATVSNAENEALLGLGLPEVWELLARRHRFPISRDAWLAAIVDDYIEHLDGPLRRPGACEAVAEIDRRGLPQGCVSTAERRIVLANLAAAGVLESMLCRIA